MIPGCKDKAGADLVNKFTDDCAERHGGQCISHFRDKVEWGLVLTASKGHAEAFLAVLPHCGPSSDVLNERLLSAPISGKHPTIMDLVTLMRLNINPHPRTFYPSYKDLDEDEREHGTTPLVESIAVGNTKFINILACAGIFKSLHDGGRFEVAIEVAIEAAVTGGNYELVAHLLDSCPNLESHPIARALQIAIAKGYQDIALMILRRGASTCTYRFELRLPNHKSIFSTAIEKGNLFIARSLLSLGEVRPQAEIHFKVQCV